MRQPLTNSKGSLSSHFAQGLSLRAELIAQLALCKLAEAGAVHAPLRLLLELERRTQTARHHLTRQPAIAM